MPLNKNVNYINYGRQCIDKADISSVVSVLKSDFITQGPKIKEFEHNIAKYCRVKYAVVVSSGTAALHISCLAAGIKSGDEAITSALTFAASANCILYCDATPVFCDIQSDTGNMDPNGLIDMVGNRTKAVIPVHFAGHPCEMYEIKKIADKHGLIIIEDAAHALGAEYRNSKIGSCRYSDMTIFSFHPIKSITTAEGGAVLTNNRKLYENLLLFRNHGITRAKTRTTSFNKPWNYRMIELGFNYRLNDMQAALGISQLRKLDRFILARRNIAKRYDAAFCANPYFNLPQERQYARSACHLYPIRLKKRFICKKDKIFKKIRKNGIGVQVHYLPVYRHPYYAGLNLGKKRCPLAEDFYESEISIPIYPALKNRQLKYVINTIFKIFKKICNR